MGSVRLKFRASTVPGKMGCLYYQVIHLRAVRQIKTEYRVYPWEWDRVGKCILMSKDIGSRVIQLQTVIEKTNWDMQKLRMIIADYESANDRYSVDNVVESYYNSIQRETSVFSYIRNNIKKLRERGNLGTANNHESVLNSFMNYRKGLDLYFAVMTSEMITEYEAYLKLRGICRNTISFYMRGLRSIYKQAAEDGMVAYKDIFKYVYTGVDKTIKRAIPIKDIRRIKNIHLTSYSLSMARDLFMFSFYTRGMSFVDIAYLRKKDIVGGNLVYRRHKTGQQLCIGWEREMQEIIDRYPSPTQYLFPVITKEDGTEYRQYKRALILTNRRLKKIAQLAGVPHIISMYTSRHSWATIARDKNVPLSVISQGLGHDSDMNTQIYLASIRTEEVDKANRKIMRELVD